MISVIFPAHNEGAWIRELLAPVRRDLSAGTETFEILVVENGSADETYGAAKEIAAMSSGTVQALSLPRADYGAALRAGLLAARGDVRVVMDLDAWDIDFVRRAAEEIRAGAGGVVGFKSFGKDARSFVRRLLTLLHRTVVGGLFPVIQGLDSHGPLALRGDTTALTEEVFSDSDAFKVELLWRLRRAGRRVASVPVSTTERRPPRTSVTRRVGPYLQRLLRLRWRGI